MMPLFQLTFYIQPTANTTEIVGLHGEYIKIRLQAPPIDGRANLALIEFIAKKLAIKKNAIRITRGEKSRIKTLVISDSSLAFSNSEELEKWILESK